jgi:hypothetical protein
MAIALLFQAALCYCHLIAERVDHVILAVLQHHIIPFPE